MAKTLLSIENLTTAFQMGGTFYPAVDDVHLHVQKNEVMAIVGESGSGKSALALSIVGLHAKQQTQISGRIRFKETELSACSLHVLNQIRGRDIGFIFQEPLSALNPLMTIGDQIEEVLLVHTSFSKAKRKEKVLALLAEVGIPNAFTTYAAYPHQLSGGMRQRVVISMAIACEPSLVIADEPTTALDVTIQAQILDLLRALQQKTGMSILLITHDFSVVAQMAHRVAVMYAGEIVELGTVSQIFENPLHPYTRSLMRSIQSMENSEHRLYAIQGAVPPLHQIERNGCRFKDRIPWIDLRAHEAQPSLHQVEAAHWVRCSCYQHFYFPKGGS